MKLSVKKPYSEIEISGKSYPKQIGNLQICGQFVYLIKRAYHLDYRNKQSHKTYKRRKKCSETEKYNAPSEV